MYKSLKTYIFYYAIVSAVKQVNVVLGQFQNISKDNNKNRSTTNISPPFKWKNNENTTGVVSATNFEKHSIPSSSFLICEKTKNFTLGTDVLLTFLLQLKICQKVTRKPWLDEECAKPSYALTDYHKASYDKICNPAKYMSFCQLTEIKQHLQPSAIIRRWLKQRNIPIQDSDDEKQNEFFRNRSTAGNLTRLEQMTCQSIESYFEVLSDQMLQNDFANFSQNPRKVFRNVRYTEWFFVFREFCEDAGCGVSEDNFKSLSVTYQDCVPKSCQVRSVVTLIIDGSIASIIAAANILVLFVFFRTSVMKNIPGYFKMALALSDVGVGLIVIPSIIYNQYVLKFTPLPYRANGSMPAALDYFSKTYIDGIGFLTNLFEFASIFTLCAASIDRYLAITRPFKYVNGKYFTKKRIVIILLTIWFAGSIWALLPIIISSYKYELSGISLILITGNGAIAGYVVCIGIPLTFVWIFNIAILLKVRSQNRRRASSMKKKSDIIAVPRQHLKPTSEDLSCVDGISRTGNSQSQNGVQLILDANQLQTESKYV